MTKPTRQRPGATSDIARRLHPNVEELMPGTPTPAAAPAQPPVTEARPAVATENVKESFSTRVPRSTLAAARAAVMATAGQSGGCRSLADLITQAVEDKVAQLQHQYNNGHPFPDPGTFRTGRPLGS
jgi:hypothetical protein